MMEQGAKYEPHIVSGLRGGQYIDNDWQLEGALLTAKLDVENTPSNAQLYLPTFEALYHFEENEDLRPFLAAGIGVFSPAGPASAQTAHVAFPLGGGLKYMLDDNLALRFDIRWVVNTEGGAEMNTGYYTGGVSWLFDREDDYQAPEPKEEREPFPEAGRQLEAEKRASIRLLVEFDFDKDGIRPEYHEHLREVAAFMKRHAAARAEIEGHTDIIGSKAYNDGLSMRRANSVMRYLIQRGGISASRLTAKGYGFSVPVASNATAEGRQRNRRVVATFRRD
jgi:OOP family OmpA-OmpF porin